MHWTECKDRCSRFLWFKKNEVLSVIILVLIFAFIFSFDMWGGAVFDASLGFKNLVITFILVGIIVLIHHLVQRFVCILFGFEPEHTIWWPGLVFSLIIAIFSNGALLFFVGSVFKIKMKDFQRIGWWRYGLNVKHQGLIAMSGNVALIIFAGFLKLFYTTPGSFIERMIIFSILFIFFNMIPWPHSDGCCMMFGSRLYFAFIVGFLIGFLYFFSAGFLTAAFLGVLTGMLAWFLFYWFFEKKWG